MNWKFKLRIKTTLTNFARCTRFGTQSLPLLKPTCGPHCSSGPARQSLTQRHTETGDVGLLLPLDGRAGAGAPARGKTGLRLTGGGGAARELRGGEAHLWPPAAWSATVRGLLATRARTHGSGFTAAAVRRHGSMTKRQWCGYLGPARGRGRFL
jgi:hypothetical protein